MAKIFFGEFFFGKNICFGEINSPQIFFCKIFLANFFPLKKIFLVKNFPMRNNYVQKISFFAKNFFWQNIFFDGIFFGKIFFGKIFSANSLFFFQKISMTKFFLQNIFLAKFFRQTFFWANIFLDSFFFVEICNLANFLGQNPFFSGIFCGGNVFEKGHCGC